MREKWKHIIRKAKAQGGSFTKANADWWLDTMYYCNAGHYSSQILKRMVEDGCIQRIRKGHYTVIRENFRKPSKKQVGVVDDPAQTTLF